MTEPTGNPRGRPPGARNKKTKELIAAAERDGGLMPLDYMLKCLRDMNADPLVRRWPAQNAAP